jgi:AraC-like DNA-binding protein
VLVFDTDTVDRRHRADAMISAMADATGSTHFTHEGPTSKAYLQLHQWQLGSATLVQAACSGHTQRRRQRGPDRDAEPVVVIGVQCAGGGVQVQDEAGTPLSPGGVYGLVLTSSYDHVSSGHTRTLNLLIPAGELNLPLALVAEARTRLESSPVRGILAAHVHALVAAADRLDGDPVAEMMAPTTLQLARAMLASASTSRPHVSEALADTLVVRVRAYILEHLQDPNLNAASIAAAHHVSQRHLYKMCAAEQFRLEPWIISRRLAAARDELATPAGRRHTIESTAMKWGFANSSHFTHRFRAAYKVTPSEWRNESQTSNPDR